MRDKNNVTQLALIVVAILTVAIVGYLGFGWLESRMGSEMAFSMFVVVFIVAVLFIQQWLSNSQTRGVLQNVVEYNAANAKVDAYRQATVLEGMKTTRQVLATDIKAQMHDARVLEQRAGQLGELLGTAKAEKLKARMIEDKTIDSSEYTLD